ncbi:TM0106 family RecB-like putative nuclease [Microbacterium sp. zg.Y625]|uniref:TM0106 family RecB-like putative nuclease n=1 Tax=Microbacterium jiangjiandongii TaxID=3049071 RepID=UPI00214AA7C7|nr:MULTISPECIES: bifunctional RecB family nuclease/DEAD/DEAH box helicase [unclassified Microbacterium]MCR2792080.1 TM0106 family RecB-like putative nuclease [Microbacterium sp. zg.Y625]WIM24886.1 TM0106 family RecB-like putative nuclease [Microbacterium sp. zg-Y625]
MRYIEDEARIVWSASDLKAAAECEFAWLRAIDAKLGRVPAVEDPDDPTLERAGRLGMAHEHRVLDEYRAAHPGRVVEIPEARSTDAAALAEAVAQTQAALRSDAAVIYQAAFATSDFVGFADFLVRDHATGSWVVQDTKLARHARVTALMQLAAYVVQLDALGVARADHVELLLGDGTTSTHAVRDLLPTFRLRRARLLALIADRDVASGAAGAPIGWGDPRGELGVIACGRCATCDLEVVAQRDLLLVAGMRPVQRDRLRTAGILTIDDLAAAHEAPPRMSWDTFAGLRTQARLQLDSPAGVPAPDAVVEAAESAAVAEGMRDEAADTADTAEVTVPVPTYEVVFPQALGALPLPDAGDLFFDFEGDPLYTEGPATTWGIDYLFGWVDVREQYSALWAHSFAEERVAFERFLDFIALRRRERPGMHIYHYAPYEPTHLLQMAARYGVREGDVDRLLRDGVFVDLYPIVRRALRVGSRSYSIKKLEPLYMGGEVRTSDVQRGDDSIVKYVQARAHAADGDGAASEVIFADLADYNRYDCVSTRRLRDWLVERAKDAGMRPSVDPDPVDGGYEPSPRAEALGRLAEGESEVDAQALRLAAAAIDYYPRERKTFWATHFLRLREPVSVWADSRDVVVFDAERSRVVQDWHRPEGGRVDRRLVELRGELAPGTRLKERGRPFVVYERPAPFPVDAGPRALHAARSAEIVEVLDDGVILSETPVDGFTWSELPVALTPEGPPAAGSQQGAIDEWADAVLAAAPALPPDAATDLLRRLPPRTRSGALARGTGDIVSDITATIADLDHSYLAVQGPPGTGKTYVGSHVIARLVAERGFRVGVVAQSHAVVENMLDRVVAAGVPRAQVAKALKDAPTGEESFTVIAKNGVAAFTGDQPAGYVIGGTAWDFCHPTRVPRHSLDLLVIDEAGQFSLASTIAVSVCATRMLLLGDPQQLPQVSQGTHPEPVDTSALGWVMDGAEVIDETHGYFLAQTWRMHPAVAEPVSQLAYAGELASHPSAAQRLVTGIAPGVHPVPIRHHGNATQSPEEAAEVVRIVRDVVGRAWTDGAGAPPRALTARDIIVVTPYNAQQVLVEEALAAAGFADVPVGTVDRFQGQEAAIAIVSLAASSGRDAPRGLEFLLLQNRLNVAISRAKYAAYVVYAPGVLDDLPRTPEGVARLSAFARLVGA